jgi:uncharacterized protein (DUF305 family)
MRRRSLVAVVAVLGLLAGCTSGESDAEAAGDGPRVLQAGAPGEPSRELTPEEAEALDLEGPGHSEADVAFVQGMIPHHVQALRMTRLVPDRTSREDVPLFAERIDLSQEDEIDVMRRWLEARDEEVPRLGAGHDMDDMADMEMDGELMPGMLTEEELLELEAATGEEFDRLFLEAMIRHHLGAMQMVEELYAQDGGQEPEISQLANHIYSDQSIEISRAQGMLAEMDEA